MAFTNEEVMRATELALRQYHVVQKGGGSAEGFVFKKVAVDAVRYIAVIVLEILTVVIASTQTMDEYTS
jgi:hypothetical protein